MADIDARLATLERRLKRVRVLALLAALLAAATPAWLLTRPAQVIEESRLWMARDEAGRLRAMLGVTADGVGLTMYDSTGQMRLDVGLAPGGVPGLVLLTPRGEAAATLNLLQDGTPTLRLLDHGQRTRVELAPGTPPAGLRGEVGLPDTMIARRPRR
jgi:hypothetical protein